MSKMLWISNVRHYQTGQSIDILIRDGKIDRIQRHSPTDCTGCPVFDGENLVVAPGLVDMHVHLRDPGQTEKEDLQSAARAAAAGGVTSLLAMPNTNPVVDTPDVVRDILTRAKGLPVRIYQAAAISKGLDSREATDMAALKAVGVIALSDDGRPVTDSRMMAEAMMQAKKLGMAVVAHCEDLDLAAGGLMHQGKVSEELGVPGIPAAAEDAGTARDIALAAAYDVPIHICHVSTKTAVAFIRDAKRRGVAVTAETAPHYLLLTDQNLRSRDADYRMNPPLRTQEDGEALIDGLCDGTIDCIATDHAPHTPAQKADFLTAPNGAIGMETSFAASYTALVASGRMTLPELIFRMSTRPAEILGIPAGTMEVGENADLILIDENETWVVDPEKLHGKSKNTPFKGMTLTGKVKHSSLQLDALCTDPAE